MSIKPQYKILSNEDISKLMEIIPVLDVQSDAILIHAGHVPNVVFVFLDGIGFLEKKRRKPIPLRRGMMIGASELLAHEPCTHNLRVLPGARVISLDRSTLKELSTFSTPKWLEGIIEKDMMIHAS